MLSFCWLVGEWGIQKMTCRLCEMTVSSVRSVILFCFAVGLFERIKRCTCSSSSEGHYQPFEISHLTRWLMLITNGKHCKFNEPKQQWVDYLRLSLGALACGVGTSISALPKADR